MKRHVPRPSELAPLLRFRKPDANITRRRLAQAFSIDDLRRIAARRTPRGPFDYTDGGADSEISLGRARQAFADLEFRPHTLRDVSSVDASTTILGRPSSLPLGLAPTGFTRMMHAAGETAVARAATRANIPYALSVMSTTPLDVVAAASGSGRRLFQLYPWKDRERSAALIQEARDSGYDGLIYTVDVPTAGNRLRDSRNGMVIPPELTLRTLVNASYRPGWWIDFLTTEPLRFANVGGEGVDAQALVAALADPGAAFEQLAWVRTNWDGPLVVKGILRADDAVAVTEAGADGIILSSHGGRQLDRAPSPLRLLPEVVREVGDDVEVMIDSGIMSGADVVAAVALGASSCWVGRAYLYGLMAGGEAGVQRAIEILGSEIARTMALLGVTRLDELTPDHVALDGRVGELRPR